MLIILFSVITTMLIVFLVVGLFTYFRSSSGSVHSYSNRIHSPVGVSMIKHDNFSKQVSECIAGAQKTMENEGVTNFSINNFYKSLH